MRKQPSVVDAWIELAVIDASTPAPEPTRDRKIIVDLVREVGISPDGKWRVSLDDDNVHLVDIEKTRGLSDDGRRCYERLWRSRVVGSRFATLRCAQNAPCANSEDLDDRVLAA